MTPEEKARDGLTGCLVGEPSSTPLPAGTSEFLASAERTATGTASLVVDGKRLPKTPTAQATLYLVTYRALAQPAADPETGATAQRQRPPAHLPRRRLPGVKCPTVPDDGATGRLTCRRELSYGNGDPHRHATWRTGRPV